MVDIPIDKDELYKLLKIAPDEEIKNIRGVFVDMVTKKWVFDVVIFKRRVK